VLLDTRRRQAGLRSPGRAARAGSVTERRLARPHSTQVAPRLAGNPDL